MLYNILNSTCLSGSLATKRDSSEVFETLVVAAAMDWARCSQDVVGFLLLFPLRLGRDLPPISGTYRKEATERGASTIPIPIKNIATGETLQGILISIIY